MSADAVLSAASAALPFAMTDAKVVFPQTLISVSSDETFVRFVGKGHDTPDGYPNTLAPTTFVPNDGKRHRLYTYTDKKVANRILRGTHEETNIRSVQCTSACACQIQTPVSVILKIRNAVWKPCGFAASENEGSKMCQLSFANHEDNVVCQTSFATQDRISLLTGKPIKLVPDSIGSVDSPFHMTDATLGRFMFPVENVNWNNGPIFVDDSDSFANLAKTTFVPNDDKDYRVITLHHGVEVDIEASSYHIRAVKCSATCACRIQSFNEDDVSYKSCGFEAGDGGPKSNFCKLSLDNPDKKFYCKSYLAAKEEYEPHWKGARVDLPGHKNEIRMVDREDYTPQQQMVSSTTFVPNNNVGYPLYRHSRDTLEVRCTSTCKCGIQGREPEVIYKMCGFVENDANSKYCKLSLSYNHCKSTVATPLEVEQAVANKYSHTTIAETISRSRPEKIATDLEKPLL